MQLRPTHSIELHSPVLTVVWLVCFVVLVSVSSAFAQNKLEVANAEFQVKHQMISVEDGLASREVQCAIMDGQGFMWFASSMGLNRYDGKNFLHFTKENHGLLSNEISLLSLGLDGNLIIHFNKTTDVTVNDIHDGCLFQVMNIGTFQLKTLDETWTNAPFSLREVIRVRNGNDGGLFVFRAFPYEVWTLSSNQQWNRVAELTPWNALGKMNMTFYIDLFTFSTFQNGILAIRPGRIHLPGYVIYSNKLQAFEEDGGCQMTSINKDGEVFLYLDHSPFGAAHTSSDMQNGLYKVSDNGSLVRSNEFASLPVNSDEDWLICSSNCAGEFVGYNPDFGLYIYSDEKFLEVIDKDELLDWSNLQVFSMYSDILGNRWLCTSIGLIQVTFKKRIFETYFSKEGRSSAGNNQVRGIIAKPSPDDPSKEIIYASVWEKVLTFPDMHLARDHDHYILYSINEHAGSLYFGLDYKLDRGQTKLDFLGFDERVWSQLSLNDSLMLVGVSDGQSICIANLGLGKIRKTGTVGAGIPTPFLVYRFIRSKNKGIIALAQNGIFRLDDQYNLAEYWGPTAPLDHKIDISQFYDLHEDSKGICWIASADQGLFRWEWNSAMTHEQPQLRQFGIADGLPALRLYRIEEDENANLWVSTYNGLMRFDTKSYTTLNFSTADGLTHNEFNRISSFKSASGRMYFGGVNGLNAFYPKAVDDAYLNDSFPLRVINFNKYSSEENALVSCMAEWNLNNQLIIYHSDRFLTLEFALLDYMKRPHLYAYRIDGIDAEWNYLTEGALRISQLGFGNYKLRVKSQLSNGQWNPEELVIPITVLEPFYLRPRYWILFLIGLLLLVVLVNAVRRIKLERANKKMEVLVENRTINLKRALDEKEVLLKEIHHRVKNNLQIVSGLVQLQKDEFIGTPDSNNLHIMSDVQSRIIRMALLHQTLYQHSEISSVRFDVFLKSLIVHVADLYRVKGRDLISDIQLGEVYIDIDTAVPLGLIINELVTNSYKYGFFENQDVHVKFQLELLSKGLYRLTYRDSGPGLPANIDFADANTLGLDLIKVLTSQLSGECIQYSDGGVVFVITFKDSELRSME